MKAILMSSHVNPTEVERSLGIYNVTQMFHARTDHEKFEILMQTDGWFVPFDSDVEIEIRFIVKPKAKSTTRTFN